MARSTSGDHYRVEPRPIGQGVWLLATMAIAAIILSILGSRLEAESGPADPAISGQDLLELAAPTVTGPVEVIATDRRTVEAEPAAPWSAADWSADGWSADGGSSAGDSVADAPVADESIPGTTTTTAQPTDRRQRGQAALDTISYPWEQLLPGWTIDFLPERDGLYGLTLVPEQRIEVYVRDGQTTAFLAHVIAHELGHAVDVSLNTGSDRRRWEAGRDLDSSSWWPGDGATDFSTGAGDFAESFAAWQVGSQSFRSKLGGPPNPEQINLLAELSAG